MAHGLICIDALTGRPACGDPARHVEDPRIEATLDTFLTAREVRYLTMDMPDDFVTSVMEADLRRDALPLCRDAGCEWTAWQSTGYCREHGLHRDS